MPFQSEGTLTTDKREVAISETWNTQPEWEAFQQKNGIDIVDGSLQLAEGDVIPASGISRYTFDDADTSSGTLADIWNGNDATILGALTGQPGANQTYTTNESYSFDGTNDYIDTGITAIDTPLSVAFWAYPESSNNDIVFGNFNATGSDLFLGFSSGGYKFQYDSGSFNIDGDGSIPENAWNHYVYTISSTSAVIYQNGTEETTASNSTTGTVDNGTSFSIGRNNNNSAHFDGRIDDLRLYDKALSQTEANSLYNNGEI